MKKFTIGAALLSIMFTGINAQSLKSPDGKFEANFQLRNGVPFYNLKYNGNVVVEDSKLGLRLFKDASIKFASEIAKPEDASFDLNNGFTKIAEKRDSKNETWQPILGEKKNYINDYNELAITLNQTSSDRSIVVKFRLFNDGLGFRYEFPQQKNLNYFVIREEDSEIDFPTDMKAWWIVADYDSQEYQYQTTKISEIPTQWPNAYDGNASQKLIKNAVQSPLMLKKEGK